MAAVTFEEEVSRLAARAAASSPELVRTAVGAMARSSAARAAADVVVYLFAGTICVLFAATLPSVVPFWACGGDCTVAWVLWEIVIYSGMLSTLLMAPALALFFLRAAGSEVKDDVDGRVRRWPRLWGAAVACSSTLRSWSDSSGSSNSVGFQRFLTFSALRLCCASSYSSSSSASVLQWRLRFDFRFVEFFAPGRDGRISAIFKNFERNLTKVD